MLRLFVAVPLAALVTLALFLFMQGMIQQERSPLSEPRPISEIIVTAKKKPTEPTPDTQRQQLPDPPPPPDLVDDTTRATPERVPTDLPNPPAPDPDKIKTSTIGSGTAIVTIAPQFPERCKSRGDGGSVTVEFNVDENGNVINPRIIASDDSCFNREVLRAISRWKFAPKIVNNEPLQQRGLRRIITFELEE